MQKSLSLLFVALLSLGGLAALPMASAAGPAAACTVTVPPTVGACPGVVEFLNLDRQTPVHDNDGDGVPDISGLGAVAVVHLYDSDIASQATVSVNVHRAGISSGSETVTLSADPVNSGHFYGQFGVELSDVSNNGRVVVVANEKLAIDYVDGAPAATVQNNATNAIEWISNTTASIGFDSVAGSSSTAYGAPGLAIISVTDTGQNTNSVTTETLIARITTVRDQVGILVNLTETTTNSGVFQSDTTRGSTESIKFGPTSNDVTNTIAAVSGDVITAAYVDAVDSLGRTNTTRTATAVWRAATLGSVSFTDSTYRLNMTNYRGMGTTANAFLRVEDVDLAGAGSVPVVVKSTADGLGTTVTLSETGSNSGEFTGSFGFIDTATVPGSRLRVNDGDNVTVTYTDSRDGSGAANTTAVDNITWNLARTGVIRFSLDDQYDANPATTLTVNSSLYFDGAKAFVELVDEDLVSQQTFPIRATSTRDPIGLTVTLKQLSSTGKFRGCFEFNNDTGVGASKSQAIDVGCDDGVSPGNLSDNQGADWAVPGGRLLVRSGDTVTISYVDANTATGGINVTAGTATQSISSLANATGPPTAGTAGLLGGKGIITFKACMTDTSTCAAGTPSGTSLVDVGSTGFFGTSAASYAWIEITDQNWNVNANNVSGGSPAIINDFVVSLSSLGGSAPATPGNRNSYDAQGNLTAGTGINVTVTETSSTSGIFRGRFNFTTAASNDTTDLLQVGSLSNPFTDSVTASYTYAGVTLSNHSNNTVINDKVGLGVVSLTTPWAISSNATLDIVDLQRQGTTMTRLVGLGPTYVQLTTGMDTSEDTSAALNAVSVRVKSTADSTGINVALTERYSHAGEPVEGAFHQTNDDAFLGTFKFSTSASSDSTDTIKVNAAGDTIFVEFDDPHNAVGLAEVRQIQRAWVPATLGTMALLNNSVATSVVRGNSSSITVQVTDSEANANSASNETVTVIVQGDRDASPSERFVLNLTETNVNTGVFSGSLFIETTVANTTHVFVTDGSNVTVTYYDGNDTNSVRSTATQTFRFFSDSHGGVLRLNKDAYVGTETATVTLWDPDADTSGGADTVKIRVYSETDGTGEIITLTETGAMTDNFTGTFGFETSRAAGNSLIAMSNADQLTAYYLDCPSVGNPCTLGTNSLARLARATWTLTGVVNAPTAGMTANVSTGQVPLPVRFSMTAADSDGSIASYSLNFGDGSAVVTGGNPNGATQDHTYAIAGTYTATLTVTDNAGLTATATATVTVTSPDTTAPGAITNLAISGTPLANSVTLNWTAPGDDGSTGTVSAYNVTVSTLEITASNIDTVARVANATFAFAPTALAVAGQTQSVTVAGLSASTTYFFAVRAIDDGSNRGGNSNFVSGRTATPDTTIPTGTLVITSSTHAAGTATENNDPAFAWSGLTDPESSITYRYALNQATGHALTTSDSSATATNVSFSNIAVGTWYFHLRGESAGGNSAQAKYTIVIVDPTPEPVTLTETQIENANNGVTLTVTRVGDANVLEWTLPANPPAEVLGVQIWRSNSPYTLLATFNAGTTAFEDGTYTDSSSGAKATSKYLVTMFYGTTAALGFYSAATAPDTENYPGTAFSSGEDSGLSNTAWILIGVGALVLIVLLVLLIVVLARRGRKDGDESAENVAWDDAPAAAAAQPDPAASQTHHLRCPACQTSFTATGAKPLTTNCPGCGRRGVLR